MYWDYDVQAEDGSCPERSPDKIDIFVSINPCVFSQKYINNNVLCNQEANSVVILFIWDLRPKQDATLNKQSYWV